jgi:16S rRNA U516 pseudouridylate synthase RsuA-like enzyme
MVCTGLENLMALIRLNKIIADAGITSRRGADELIQHGRVSVDGLTIREQRLMQITLM